LKLLINLNRKWETVLDIAPEKTKSNTNIILKIISIKRICKYLRTTTLKGNMVSNNILIAIGDVKAAKTAKHESDNDGEQADVNGRITKGPFTLKNGAVYTGQWLNGMRDGYGT
jgi:hypothetical protein